MNRIFTISNYFVALLFIFAAAVQYNDPDSIRWIALYTSAALACIYWLFGSYQRWVCGVVLLICVIWLITIIVDLKTLSLNLADLVSSLEMKNETIEQYREIGGLILIAIWMSILFFKNESKNN